jgi:hypothetical protein
MRRLLAAASAAVQLAAATDSCGPGFAATWSGNGTEGTMSFVTAQDCIVPSPDDLTACLSGRRIHLVGDSTLRMPLQYFESVWLRCAPVTPGGNKWTPGAFHALRPDSTKEDHAMCADLNAVTRAKFVQLSHPLNRLALTYDTWK